MPVSPELARELAKAVAEIYGAAEARMLELVGAALARGIDGPGWEDRTLARVHAVRLGVERIVADLADEGAAAASEAIVTAHGRGVATAARDLVASGAIPAIAYSPITGTATVDALVGATVGRLASTHLRIVRTALDVYQATITETAAQVATGTMTRRQASAEALARFARRGVTGFVDSAGRSWDLVSYAEMSVRTSSGQAAVQGGLDRLVESGRDLVIVSNAPEECRLCRPWEGQVLSISGATTGVLEAEDIRTGRTTRVTVAGTMREATRAGLFHPNCRHSVAAYTPGVTRPMTRTADPEGDRLRQRQRALERAVRRAKAEEAAVGPLGGPQAAKARARRQAAAGRLRQFVDEHDRKPLSYRTSLVAR